MFRLTTEAVDPVALKAELEEPRAGSIVVFEGLVRNHNEGLSVDSLEYEAFADLCFAEADRIMGEAKKKFGVYDVRCTHRVGHLAIGDIAVWIGVSSAHRSAGFQACRFIIDEIKTRLPIWKKEHYSSGEAEWVNCQQCAQAVQGHDHHHHHGDETCSGHHHQESLKFTEEAYYSRQVSLPGFGKEGQQALREARVLVIGAGGLGSAALPYLATAGIGTLGISDGDLVDASNLHRQILYGWKDVEHYKADVAAEKLKAMNPFIEVIPHREHIDFENAQRLISLYDVVVDCTDNFKAKFLIHDLCRLLKKPLVQASIFQMEGQIQVFDPRVEAGCLRCEWPVIPEEGCVGTCVDAGVLGVIPGYFGTLQAMEAIKLLIDWQSPLRHQTQLVDLTSGQQMPIERRQNPRCPLCGEKPSITGIEVENYQAKTKDFEVAGRVFADLVKDYVLIDIRGGDERSQDGEWVEQMAHLPGASVEQCVAFGGNKGPLLIVCRKGIRSLNLVEQIRQAGFDKVYSLAGGTEGLLF